MDAYDFAKQLGQLKEPEENYCFGVDPKNWSRSLREIADAIDLGLINPQSSTIVSKADIEDFTFTTLILKFSEKVDINTRQEQKKITEVTRKLDNVKKLYS